MESWIHRGEMGKVHFPPLTEKENSQRASPPLPSLFAPL